METHTDRTEVTNLLDEWSGGRKGAFDELYELVYQDLGLIARRHLRDERQEHTLNTQALVHESYVRLFDKPGSSWRDRAQFYAVASTAMRRVLVDYARKRQAYKRGGNRIQVTLGDGVPTEERDLDELLTLEDGLERLGALDQRLVKIVECRFFGALTMAETARALGVSLRTAERDWTRARAHLYRYLTPDTRT